MHISFLGEYSPLLLLCLVAAVYSCGRANDAGAESPNIIFILADDHAAQAISAYGSRINRTPNIDRLAQEGMRFDRVYCTNSICAPSRAVILTGKFSHLNGVLDNRLAFDGSQSTFPKLLQRAGYQTAFVGKWHLKSQPTGFDYWNVLPGQGLYYNPVFIEMGEHKEYEGYVTDLTTDFALNWLDSLDREKPFFLFLGTKAPHRNWMPGPEHLTLYENETIPEPPTLFDDYGGRSAAAREQEMSIARDLNLDYDLKVPNLEAEGDSGLDGWMNRQLQRMTPEQREAWNAAYNPQNEDFLSTDPEGDDLVRWKYQRYIKDYLRSIASVDDNVGRLLDYLEEKGLAENTVVIYSSDQGFYLGEHGWFDKRFMYEESYRMPFIVRYPEVIAPGAVSDALGMNVDFAPTLLDLAGLEVPGDMQGRSLLPILETGRTPSGWREATYYHYYEYPGAHMVKRHYGVRTDRYKLIHFYHDIDAWELFDLAADPHEMTSLYDDPGYAGLRDSLTGLLYELQRQYGESPEQFKSNLSQKHASHLAFGAPVTFRQQPGERFARNAEEKLTDGIYWEYSLYAPIRQSDWVGFRGQPFEAVIDLGNSRELKTVKINFFQSPEGWIYYPETINCAVSEDGKNFHHAGGTTIMDNQFREGTELFEIGFPETSARYIQLTAVPMEYIPSDLPGGGEAPWLMVDEVIAEGKEAN